MSDQPAAPAEGGEASAKAGPKGVVLIGALVGSLLIGGAAGVFAVGPMLAKKSGYVVTAAAAASEAGRPAPGWGWLRGEGGAELQRYIDQGWVVPIDTTLLPNTAHQLSRFRNFKSIPGITRNGKVFAIPYTYAEMGLIYDRKQVKEVPTSIRALWDPRYRGKVLMYNSGTHNFSLAAQSLREGSPFHVEDTQWPALVNQLIALRRNVLGFYSQPEESVDLFRRKRAALMLANYGTQQLQLLKKAGADVGYAIPDEGALAWLDCWVITRGAKNTALAAAWIDYLLETAPSEALVTRQGLANTISPPPYLRPEDNLKWLEPVENIARRNQLWERILAGDRARKVMAP